MRTTKFAKMTRMKSLHCIKSFRIRSYSGPQFPAFGLNTERYSVSLLVQSKCGKIRIRINSNTETFYALLVTIPQFVKQNQCLTGHSFVSVAYIKNKAQLYDVANVTGLVCNISEIARVEKTEEAILFEKSNTYSVW